MVCGIFSMCATEIKPLKIREKSNIGSPNIKYYVMNFEKI